MTDAAPRGVKPPARRGWTRMVPLATGLGVGAIALACISPVPVGTFWDDGVYLIGARSLAEGAGYRLAHLPGSPGNVHFPPGYPALLALVWMVFPHFPANVVWLRLLNPLLLGVAAGLACRFGARRLGLPPPTAAAAVLVSGASLPLLVVSGVLFSEPLFLVVLVAALFACDRAAEQGGTRQALVAGLAIGAVALVRTAGLALLPALLAVLLLGGARRRAREVFVATVGAVAVVAPWQLWVASQSAFLAAPLRGSYGPYFEWVAALYRERGASFALVIARENIVALFRTLGIALFPFGPRPLRPLLVALVVVVACFGVASVHRRARVLALFLLCYMALVLAWPYAPDRFLWAVWPLVALVVALGSVEAWRLARASGPQKGVRAAAALACSVGVFALGGHAAYSVRGVSRHWHDSAARLNAAALGPVVDWVHANTAPGDVVACDGEPFVHLYTGRTVVPVHILSPDEFLAGTPLEEAAENMRALFASQHPVFAVFSAASAELAAAPLLDGANGTIRLEPIAQLPGGGVAFRVRLP